MTRQAPGIQRRWGGREALVAFALLVATGCEPSPEPPFNVLLISLDTTRKDRLSAYGYSRDTSPTLARLARKGTRFDAAYSPTASTGPTHASVFTGLYPIAHRVLENGAVLRPEHETLAERFASRGYQTAAVVSSFALAGRFGFEQGFEVYDDDFQVDEATIPEPKSWQGVDVDGAFDRRADHTSRRAIRWLREERTGTSPFLLFVHYFDPHMPYLPPPSHRWRYTPRAGAPESLSNARSWEELSAWYDGEVRFMDDQIGDLLNTLEELALANNTLVVVFGDHGEGLRDHGVLTHGLVLYEEAVAVPLVIRTPGAQRAGQVIEDPVELVDVMPTVLDLSRSLRKDGAFQGRNLAPRMRGESELDPEQPVYLYRVPRPPGVAGIDDKIRVDGELFGIRVGRWKYIVGDKIGKRELFDLESDPKEAHNQIDERPGVAEELSARLQAWRRSVESMAPVQADNSDEARDGLRALGYVD